MAGRDGQGQVFSPGSRKRDRTVEDALKTMERLGQWLEMASEEDVWRQLDDPLQVAMLHGMLFHLQQEIERVLALGGEDVEETIRVLRTLSFATRDSSGDSHNLDRRDASERTGLPGSHSQNRRTPAAQGGNSAGG